MKFLNFCNDIKIFNNLSVNESNSILFLKKYDMMHFSFFKKHLKTRKIFLKTFNNKLKNDKKDSVRRDKNNTLIEHFLNVSIKGGNKLVLLKHFNLFLNSFYLSFNEKNDDLLHYKDYLTLFNLLKYKKNYYNFDFLLKESILPLESLFNVQLVKINKKNKNKSNKKYTYNVIYINKKKRLKHVLKLINNYTEKFKYYNYWERLFWTFMVIITDQKNSFLWKRKFFVYKKTLQLLYKKIN